VPDGIVLVGMPASGKSTVGRVLARRLGKPFVDIDDLVARRLGVSVPDFIDSRGERAFRDEEAQAVKEAMAVAGAVIATGGGTVLDPINRWLLWEHGTVAWLDVTPDRIVRRLAADPVPRPTFQPYRRETMARTLADRTFAYRAADVRIDASGTPAAVARELASIASPRPSGKRLFDGDIPRNHPVGPHTTRLVMGLNHLATANLKGFSIVDRRLAKVAPDVLKAVSPSHVLEVRSGERAKRLRSVERILEELSRAGVERGTPLIAVGGGTIGDLVGTAAALYARGLPLIHVPITWLAQADSAIGGKVAVDLGQAKNAAGAFWPPIAIFSELAALRTLPISSRRDGMAECIKTGMIGDPVLWRLIEDRGAAALRRDEASRYAIIERSARLKLAICGRDPFETGERRTLNLGHTIGHALEIESGYRLKHGAAVALGMRAVAVISARRGADPDLVRRQDDLLGSLGYRLHHAFDEAAVRLAMRRDKKREAGRQRWILPLEIGRVIEVNDVTDAELSAALKAIRT
jgi:shikimate kinase/3-dehydroquinate synthase